MGRGRSAAPIFAAGPAALTGRRVPSNLEGEFSFTGVWTPHAPEGEVRLALSRSRIRELTLDSVYTVAGLHDSLISVDTAYAVWKGARVGGSGTLGWTAPHNGRMAFTLAADSLIAFDSLLLADHRADAGDSPDRRRSAGLAKARFSWPEVWIRSRWAATRAPGCEWQQLGLPS